MPRDRQDKLSTRLLPFSGKPPAPSAVRVLGKTLPYFALNRLKSHHIRLWYQQCCPPYLTSGKISRKAELRMRASHVSQGPASS